MLSQIQDYPIMEIISEGIFVILCRILSWVGSLVGLNYEEIFIVICCHLWPIICTLSTLPIIYYIIKRIKIGEKKGRWITKLVFASLYVIFYIYCTVMFIDSTPAFSSTIPGLAEAVFSSVMVKIKDWADLLGVTYTVMNLIIYILGFTFILALNYTLAQKVNPERKPKRIIGGSIVTFVAGLSVILLVQFSWL